MGKAYCLSVWRGEGVKGKLPSLRELAACGRILVLFGSHPESRTERHWRPYERYQLPRRSNPTPQGTPTAGIPITKVTMPALAEMKRQGKAISALTAYDYSTSRLADEAGIDLILVGDSLAMVVLGHENTLAVTVDEMLHHTRAVRRAVRRALLVADMPFGSYHGTVGEGVANAVRFVKEAGAEAVKIEGPRMELVRALQRGGDSRGRSPGTDAAEPSPHGRLPRAGAQRRRRAGAEGRCAGAGRGGSGSAGAGRRSARGGRGDHRRAADSDDRDRRRAGLRRADPGLPRHGGPDLCAGGQVCAPLCGCGGADSLGHRTAIAKTWSSARFLPTRRATTCRRRRGGLWKQRRRQGR